MDDFVTLDEDEWLHHISNDLSPDTSLYLQRNPARFHPTYRPSDSSTIKYVLSLLTHLRENRSIRGKQARLTLWEVLELFDVSNDALFLLRVSDAVLKDLYDSTAQLSGKLAIGQSAMMCLICLYVVSISAYLTRHHWIYHRIPEHDQSLFVPLASLAHIRRAGVVADKLDSLFMFERLVWTYQLAMRVLEDVPQVIISTLFLANYKKDAYTFFMIAYSITLLLLTSYRMGSQFPLLRTLTLFFSRRPPVDSPVLEEAAPPTRHFALFLSFYFAAWSVCHGACASLFTHIIWRSVCKTACAVSAILSFLLAVHWLYLIVHSAAADPGVDLNTTLDAEEVAMLIMEPRSPRKPSDPQVLEMSLKKAPSEAASLDVISRLTTSQLGDLSRPYHKQD